MHVFGSEKNFCIIASLLGFAALSNHFRKICEHDCPHVAHLYEKLSRDLCSQSNCLIDDASATSSSDVITLLEKTNLDWGGLNIIQACFRRTDSVLLVFVATCKDQVVENSIKVEFESTK